VVRAVQPARPHAPERGAKSNHRQQKEDAGHFQPENTAHAAEGAQKAAHAASHASGCLSGSLSYGPVRRCIVRRRTRRSAGRSRCARSSVLAGNPPGNPQADAQGAANGVRFHSIYDGSSDAAGLLFHTYWRFTVAPRRRRT